MRRHISYANVAATLALVFAMSGGAMAAKHYLISSTKQISPKVLKKLKGNAGARGVTGATGATGAQGKEGAAGKEGAVGKEGLKGLGSGTLAMAFMDRTGTLKDVRNFATSYAKPGTGEYCLTPTGGVSSSTSPIAMVTVEHGFSTGTQEAAFADGGICPAGQYGVVTFEPGTTFSNNVAFYITIPG
jgi:hypothetical protein